MSPFEICRGTMTMQSPDESPHWGSYSFMYGPLTPAEILNLEKAIFARRLGRYTQARQLWDVHLPPPHTVPVLALEKAELEARLLRYRCRLAILEKFLSSQAEWRQTPSEQEVKLLTILATATRVEVYGSLHQALLEAREMKSMWQGRSVEEWSPIEVRLGSGRISI